MSLFRKSAGYRYLDAFILANVVELATRHFCVAFLNARNDPGGRTFAQMTHAARSGSRNFAEGSERLMTSYASAMELLDAPPCPQCGALMRQRRTRKDNRPFWGCTQYPACRGVVEYGKEATAVGSNRLQSTAAEKTDS